METQYTLLLNRAMQLASGPLVWISLVVCIAGCIVRTHRLLSATRSLNREIRFSRLLPIPLKKVGGISLEDIKDAVTHLKLTILGVSPVTICVSLVFHLCLFVVPIFLSAHSILLDESIGISLWSLSDRTADIMTQVFLGCALFFLLRRIFIPRYRIITSFYDYVIWTITTAPFLTGLLAYYQIGDYRTMITLHMLTGELMLVAIPFTKIYHMVFFFVGRFVFAGPHTFGKGYKTW